MGRRQKMFRMLFAQCMHQKQSAFTAVPPATESCGEAAGHHAARPPSTVGLRSCAPASLPGKPVPALRYPSSVPSSGSSSGSSSGPLSGAMNVPDSLAPPDSGLGAPVASGVSAP